MTDKGIHIALRFGAGALLAAALLPATSCIDEDLDRCGSEYPIEYRLQLAAEPRATLESELSQSYEQEVKQLLVDDLGDVLSGEASVFDMYFYSEDYGGALTHQETAKERADRLSLAVYLRTDVYDNIAVASSAEVSGLSLEGSDRYGDMVLRQPSGETIDSHAAAVYAGRKRLDLADGSAQYVVDLYMQNSVPVVTVDRGTSAATLADALVGGTASAVECADSVFVFDGASSVKMCRVDASRYSAYHAVCFPSRDAVTRTDGAAALWTVEIHARAADGDYTRSVLSIEEPLKAGELMVVKTRLKDDGSIVCDDPEVGVSVELDWKPGGDYDIEI